MAFLGVIENVGDAAILGANGDVTRAPTDNLTTAGACSVVDTAGMCRMTTFCRIGQAVSGAIPGVRNGS